MHLLKRSHKIIKNIFVLIFLDIGYHFWISHCDIWGHLQRKQTLINTKNDLGYWYMIFTAGRNRMKCCPARGFLCRQLFLGIINHFQPPYHVRLWFLISWKIIVRFSPILRHSFCCSYLFLREHLTNKFLRSWIA